MRWLRLRPQTYEELDQVDWRGRWITSDDEGYTDDEEEMGPMEDFDPVSILFGNTSLSFLIEDSQDAVGDDEDEEEEEEEQDENVEYDQSGAGRRHVSGSQMSPGHMRPPTPLHASVASSPPASSSVASPPGSARSRKETSPMTYGIPFSQMSGGGARVRAVRTTLPA